MLGQVVDEETQWIRWLDEFQRTNESWKFYHTFLAGLWMPLVKRVTGRSILFYADPSGRNRAHDLTSWVSNLGSADPPVPIIVGPKVGTKSEWLDFIRERIRLRHFDICDWCALTIDALGQYHFPLDSEGNPIPGEHDPVHDESSHLMDAKRYVYAFRWHAALRQLGLGAAVGRMLVGGAGHRDSREAF